MGKTGFQKFNEKAFTESSIPQIGTPVKGEGRMSREERRRRAVEDAAGKPSGRRGRPAGKKENQVAMNFIVDAEFKERLYALRDRLHRGSVKDLFIEAVTDLFTKYEGVGE